MHVHRFVFCLIYVSFNSNNINNIISHITSCASSPTLYPTRDKDSHENLMHDILIIFRWYVVWYELCHFLPFKCISALQALWSTGCNQHHRSPINNRLWVVTLQRVDTSSLCTGKPLTLTTHWGTALQGGHQPCHYRARGCGNFMLITGVLPLLQR